MTMLTEIIIISAGMLILLADAFSPPGRRGWIVPTTLAALTAALIAHVLFVPQSALEFGGRFAVDGVTWWFKVLFLVATLLTVLISVDVLDARKTRQPAALRSHGEYCALVMFTLAGMLFLISARDLITLYVSLELATIPLFTLAAWKRTSRSCEAGLKYVVLGAMSSALLLYSFSLLYGLTGSMDLSVIADRLRIENAWLAMALAVAAVGFKMSIVPFHMWAADVYEGAPTAVTAYLSVGSKAAGLALLFQLYFRVFQSAVPDWGLLVAVLAAATMTLGNIVAIVQTNIKRFMAFSSISQAGYIVMGLLGNQSDGVPAMMYYMLVYIVTNLVVFAVIILVKNEHGTEEIAGYRGLSKANPIIALCMMIALFGLAGIPPLSGFVGKFFLFSVAAKEGYHWLVAVAALNSTLSLYYYLQVVRAMYIEAPHEGQLALRPSRGLAAGVCAMALATVLLGIMPQFYETIRTQTAAVPPALALNSK